MCSLFAMRACLLKLRLCDHQPENRKNGRKCGPAEPEPPPHEAKITRRQRRAVSRRLLGAAQGDPIKRVDHELRDSCPCLSCDQGVTQHVIDEAAQPNRPHVERDAKGRKTPSQFCALQKTHKTGNDPRRADGPS
jgi:hypothetical protein